VKRSFRSGSNTSAKCWLGSRKVTAPVGSDALYNRSCSVLKRESTPPLALGERAGLCSSTQALAFQVRPGHLQVARRRLAFCGSHDRSFSGDVIDSRDPIRLRRPSFQPVVHAGSVLLIKTHPACDTQSSSILGSDQNFFRCCDAARWCKCQRKVETSYSLQSRTFL
jgi:hypothetical protein